MDDSSATRIAHFPTVISLPVLWGDMDAFGHVNNVQYFRWFESARLTYIEQANLQVWLSERNWGPILVSANCSFRRQIVYPDTVRVGARVTKLGRTSMTIQHHLMTESKNELAAEGESVVVLFDYQAQRPVRIPVEIKQSVSKMEGKEF